MTSRGIEKRCDDRFRGKGQMVFPDGTRIAVAYIIEVWREYSYGHPLRPMFIGKVSSREDSLLALRHKGKEFILEMEGGKRLALMITKDDGTVEHPPGVVEGFPGIATHS